MEGIRKRFVTRKGAKGAKVGKRCGRIFIPLKRAYNPIVGVLLISFHVAQRKSDTHRAFFPSQSCPHTLSSHRDIWPAPVADGKGGIRYNRIFHEQVV